MIRLSLLAAALTATALPVLAQQNEVYIEQRGIGNQLTIDQSQAVNSSVRGLGSPNGLMISAGETIIPLTISNALDLPRTDRATQSGNDNKASVTVRGDGGDVMLTQRNTGLLENSATIDLTGAAQAAIGQFGTGNAATLTATGNAQGLIVQNGNLNTGELVVGDGLQGTLVQNGTNNNAGIVDVQGIATSVTYIQNGNNLAPANGQGVSVISNAAAVTITQTSFGTGN